MSACWTGLATVGTDSASTPAEFVRTITGCLPACYVNRRTIRGGIVTQDFWHPDDRRMQRIAQATAAKQNLYFGVAPRTAAKGDGAHCYGLSSLFVDLDFKTTPSDQAQAILAGFPLIPTGIVSTGAGLHIYWSLIDAMLFPQGLALARSLLRRLAIMLEADLAAAEPARILRVPASLNHKYDPPRPVAITHWAPSLRYSVGQFETMLADVADGRRKDGGPRLVIAPDSSPAGRFNGSRPSDEFNRRARWSAILEPRGWQLYHASGDYRLWTRPGKSRAAGPSASTNYRGNGLLHVFSSNAAPFVADCNYSKFAAFALLEHAGDFARAAAEIRRWRMA